MKSLVDTGFCLPYNGRLKERARDMRKNPTKAEEKLWEEFLQKQNIQFYRQKILYHYIADFYCPKLKLVIELDGDQHYTNEEIKYDEERTNNLDEFDIRVIRFKNEQVLNDFDKVCKEINNYIKTLP